MKQDTLNKISEFQEYTLNHVDYRIYDVTEEEIISYIQTLTNAVNSYYGSLSGNAGLIDKCSRGEFLLEFRKQIKYSKDSEFDFKWPTNFPFGYFDFSQIFYNIDSSILSTSNEIFFNAWTFPPKRSSEEDPKVELKNSLIQSWISSYSSEPGNVTPRLQAIADFCEQVGNNDNIYMFENRGDVEFMPEQADLIQLVFITRKLKATVNDFGIPAYIPTSIS